MFWLQSLCGMLSAKVSRILSRVSNILESLLVTLCHLWPSKIHLLWLCSARAQMRQLPCRRSSQQREQKLASLIRRQTLMDQTCSKKKIQMEAWEYCEVTLEIVMRKLILRQNHPTLTQGISRILLIFVDGRSPVTFEMHETLAKIGDSLYGLVRHPRAVQSLLWIVR